MLQNKTIVVVGLGKSGLAAARLCLDRGAKVIGTDTRTALDGDASGIDLVLGGHEGVPFEQAQIVVVSPGVPPLAQLGSIDPSRTEVIGEVELACRFISAPVIAVGGTNGKSTTTTLLGTILSEEFDDVFIGGNLGRPACEAAAQPWDVVVLEVSSFQMERVSAFRPKVSVLLNVTEDHLDRYARFEDYANAKGNAFLRQGPGDTAVFPAGNALCEQQARRGHGALVSFGPGGDYRLSGTGVVEQATGEQFSLSESDLYGTHNWLNAAAAIAAARSLGGSGEAVRRGVDKFEPLAHRLTLVSSIDSVNYYDDSKATNVDAAATAIRGMRERRIILIAGGRDKLGDYGPLVDAVRSKHGVIVLIGEAAERIAEECQGRVDAIFAQDMIEAVEQASYLAEAGDAVLLSPACSSFDMFKSYADRGDQFAKAVIALVGGGV